MVAADAETRRGDIDLISSYSDIVLPAGVIQTEVEFYLVNLKDQRAHVKLEVAEIPERWEIVIEDQANNYQVKSVALEPEAIAILSLGIKIPSDAEGGINQFQIRATSGTDTVVAEEIMTVAIASGEVAGSDEGVILNAVYPAVAGSPAEVFAFEVILNNQTGKRTTFDLASEAPAGWEVVAVPVVDRDKVISGLTVREGAMMVLQVQVTAPSYVEPGRYPIIFSAWSGATRDDLDLEVVVKGTGELEGTMSDGRLSLNATAGEELSEVYRIINIGKENILGINLLSNPPAGWEVKMEPKLIELLPPGETRDVAITIKPAADAVPGDYYVVLAALNPDTTDTVLLRIDVEHSTLWRWFGLASLVLVIASLMGLYARLNTRG